MRFHMSINAALSAVAAGGIATGAAHGWFRVGVLAVASPLGVLGVLRAQRLDFLLGDQGVVVRNYWRTYQFEWSDVRFVRMGRLWVGLGPQAAVAFFLRERRVVRVQTTPGGKANHAQIFEAIAKLAPPDVPVGPDVQPER
jgi:hypothetical protein